MQFLFQKKSLILSIMLFLLALFIFIFLYRFINDSKETLQSSQERWQTEESKRNGVRSLVNSVKKVAPERAQLEQHFVQSSDVVPFLDTIESLAKKVGVKSEVVSVNVAVDNSSLMVETKNSGSFENIYKLIMLLENSPYNLEFILVDIKNSNGDGLSVDKSKKAPEWTAAFQIKLLSFIK